MTFSRHSSRLARIVTLGAVGFLLVAATFVAVGAPASAATAVTVTFEVSGAQGAGGGLGGTVTGTATLDAGTDIAVYVGGTNGFNGGGDPGTFADGPGMAPAGNGGGASDLRIGGTDPSNRVLVAGGGGGVGGGWLDAGAGGGGGAGGLPGLDGSRGSGDVAGFGGSGATANAAGSGGGTGGLGGTAGVDGSSSTGGAGGASEPADEEGGAGGGGGGGWFGGGGGGGTCCINGGGGGGGGSNHVDAMFSNAGSTTGTRGGNGRVRMSLDGGTTWVTTFSYTGAPQTYTVPEPPHPDSIDPIAGSTAGGTAVTLTGTDLTDTSSVLVCGQAVSNLDVVSDTEVSFTTPTGSVGSCDVTVRTHASGTATLDDAFRYFAVPAVTSVDPDNGPSAGGTAITIHGSGFIGAGAPTIGGVTASDVDVVNDTTITATTRAHADGTVDVVVTTPDASGTGIGAFRYYTSPASLALSPDTGPTAGATAVTLTGTDLTDTSAVLVCGQPATGLDVVSDTEVDFTTPAGDVGACDVTVQTNASGSTTLDGGFRYFAVPAVTSVAPEAGLSDGGTAVTITGTGFTGATSVTFGGTAATGVTVVNDTSITATTPAHADGSVDVVVTTPDASGTGTDAYRYYTSPASLALSPDTGPTDGATAVTLTGAGLSDTSAVLICGQPATGLDVVSDTEVDFTTPPGDVGTCDVTVQTNANGSSTLDGGFRYFAVPAIADVAPSEGPAAGGSAVTVTGSGFTGATSVSFGGTAATGVTVVDDMTITATAPAHAAGSVDVVVTTPDTSGTATDGFTYNAAPASLDLSPSTGPAAGGTAVALTGTHLADTTGVLVCGQAGTDLDVVSDTEVDFTTPAGSVGSCNVVVQTSDSGATTLTNGFRYFAVPTVTSVDPTEGPVAGGVAVTIHGSGFTGATSVTFGDAEATDVDVVDGTTITATLPAHVAGTVDVVVTTPDASGTGADAFTYDSPASFLTVSPVAGPTAGGTTITISGAGLATTSGVTVGGTAASDVTVQDDTKVTAVVPAGALGEADVVVTTAGGSTTLTGAFTYTESAGLDLGSSSVVWGGTLDVAGQGFDPGSEVTLTLHSDPIVLGTVTAGADGRFTATVMIPAVEPGDHTLVATGVNALGRPLSPEAPVTVSAGAEPMASATAGAAPDDASSAAADGSLPKTGTDPVGPLTTGVGLVVVGIGICVTRRRRLS
ncbi:MAG: IPT/TIG domain-containing protein [Acidimicrobiia bacterium]|nr:IPT/TIG domain-containing protein [Acidimicrobiia bacterium]